VVATQTKVVVGGNNKPFNANETYSLPRQRIVKQEIPTLEQIRSDIEPLRADVQEAQAD
jgi:hypothetical protein